MNTITSIILKILDTGLYTEYTLDNGFHSYILLLSFYNMPFKVDKTKVKFCKSESNIVQTQCD